MSHYSWEKGIPTCDSAETVEREKERSQIEVSIRERKGRGEDILERAGKRIVREVLGGEIEEDIKERKNKKETKREKRTFWQRKKNKIINRYKGKKRSTNKWNGKNDNKIQRKGEISKTHIIRELGKSYIGIYDIKIEAMNAKSRVEQEVKLELNIGEYVYILLRRTLREKEILLEEFA